jgi:ATP-dependent DNA ligase
MPGGSRYEPKFDGYRCTAVVRDVGARLWSRRGADLTAQFSDVARAVARMLPAGSVIDSELCVLTEGRLSFEALHKRLVTAPAKASRVRAELPASFMVFDLLAVGGVDVRPMRWEETRRRRLEGLSTTWSPPVQLSPVTSSRLEAEEWFDVLPDQLGIEGLVVKGAAAPYTPGKRTWRKVKRRDTVEILVGGVIGPIKRPEVVIAGRYRGDELVMVGRTIPLTARQSEQLGAVLRPAGSEHPWPDEIGPGHWGRRTAKVPLTKVDPVVVAEVAADAAVAGGVWRHAAM